MTITETKIERRGESKERKISKHGSRAAFFRGKMDECEGPDSVLCVITGKERQAYHLSLDFGR